MSDDDPVEVFSKLLDYEFDECKSEVINLRKLERESIAFEKALYNYSSRLTGFDDTRIRARKITNLIQFGFIVHNRKPDLQRKFLKKRCHF